MCMLYHAASSKTALCVFIIVDKCCPLKTVALRYHIIGASQDILHLIQLHRYIHQRSQTSYMYTTLCNGAVSHGAKFWGLQVC